MKRWLVWLVASLVPVTVGSYAWTHRRHFLPATAADQAPPEATYAEAQEAQKMVVVTGPMADYVLRQKPANVVTLQPISHQTSAADRVGESPVGTSTALVSKTFRVNGIVNLPFEIPAHASTPTLHGTYHSFIQQSAIQQTGAQPGGSPSGDSADVEFLLLNEKQFNDFLNGRPGDAAFSADSAHDGEVNFSLPPTLAQPVWYYLVFRNTTPDAGKKFVQADFRVDY